MYNKYIFLKEIALNIDYIKINTKIVLIYNDDWFTIYVFWKKHVFWYKLPIIKNDKELNSE